MSCRMKQRVKFMVAQHLVIKLYHTKIATNIRKKKKFDDTGRSHYNYEICFQVHPLASSAFIVGLFTETRISIQGSITITSNIVVNGTDNTEGINMVAYILQPMTMSMPLA